MTGTTTNVGSTAVSVVAGDTVLCVAPDATLHDLARLLTDDDIGAAVVGDVDHVLGIVSERDLVHAVAAHRDLADTQAVEVANTSLVWCDASATIAEVAEEMAERWVRHVLLEDDGRLVGIVSARDLLGAYAAAEVEATD